MDDPICCTNCSCIYPPYECCSNPARTWACPITNTHPVHTHVIAITTAHCHVPATAPACPFSSQCMCPHANTCKCTVHISVYMHVSLYMYMPVSYDSSMSCCFPFSSIILCLPLLQHSARFASLRLHRDLRFRRHIGPTFLPSSYPLDLPLHQPMDRRHNDGGFEFVDETERYVRKWKRWSVHMMVKAWSRSQWANLGAWLKWYKKMEADSLRNLAFA